MKKQYLKLKLQLTGSLMRAPQLGHNKGKRRGSHATPAAPKLFRAVGLHGPNQPMPTRRIRYIQPEQSPFTDGSKGTVCKLSLWHKNAGQNLKARKRAFGADYQRGPNVTKQSAVVVNTPKQQGQL